MDFPSLFPRLLSSNRLSHGYLFHGPNLPVASSVARSLACFLEKGEWRLPTGALTDCLELSSPRRRLIGIDDARFVRQFLFIHPLASRRRLAIIHGAEHLTPEAQHSLLKVSEDAPTSSLIILIAGNREALLPTIVSRFQSLFFAASPDIPMNLVAAADISAAMKFLAADSSARRLLIKNIVERERASAKNQTPSSVGREDFTLPFLEALSFVLYNAFSSSAGAAPLRQKLLRASRYVLSLSANLNEFELNRRLALESLAVALERFSVV